MAIDGTPTRAEVIALAEGGAGGNPSGYIVARHFASITKTNIGATYADIYVAAAFAERNLASVDWTAVTEVRIVWIWDYVGTGAQQVRWVDQANNAVVLYESSTFTADQDPADSGWFAKPVGITGVRTMEWQGKSSVAGDDPIPKGYVIFVK